MHRKCHLTGNNPVRFRLLTGYNEFDEVFWLDDRRDRGMDFWEFKEYHSVTLGIYPDFPTAVVANNVNTIDI